MNLLLTLLILAPQEPSFEGIKYEKPELYKDLPKSFGDVDRIRKEAAPLKGKNADDTLGAIHRWIASRLRWNKHKKYEWRNVTEVMDDKDYIGCADHALVFGALARACGIPTVWVKTMDVDWIHEFRADPKGYKGNWRGHVFLEVYVDKKWRLLDAQGTTLYDRYDPKQRILPGSRYAYDKGGEPYELVLSMRWEDWLKQTRSYFEEFDLSLLPVIWGRPLVTPVHIAGNSPVYEMVEKRCAALGMPVGGSFNGDFDNRLQRARGHWLVLTCVGRDLVLPEKYHASHSPLSPAQIRDELKKKPHGTDRRTLDDGTKVILIYGQTVDDIQKQVEALKFD